MSSTDDDLTSPVVGSKASSPQISTWSWSSPTVRTSIRFADQRVEDRILDRALGHALRSPIWFHRLLDGYVRGG
jgi:hypothetical protein